MGWVLLLTMHYSSFTLNRVVIYRTMEGKLVTSPKLTLRHPFLSFSESLDTYLLKIHAGDDHPEKRFFLRIAIFAPRIERKSRELVDLI